MSIKRKYQKLIRDPKLFFSDMLVKHHKLINVFKSKKKYNGQNQFTVVSAVYGVEKYLDDYFTSLVNQNLDFKKHIQLILVDDGSLDGSAEIIKKWQKKYPNNITYLYKDNGGQASARNLGLEHVKTEWVTFIDPDDFVSSDYFYEINQFVETSDKDIGFIGCNLYFYIENTKQYKNTHPLRYKFSKGNQLLSKSDLGKNIQMSASASFFRMRIINNNFLLFNDRVKPNFEDAFFIGQYLFYADELCSSFLVQPKYFYRKREDGTSTLDVAWSDKRKFSDVFIHGYLPLLEFYMCNQGKIPNFIQRQVFYDLSWYFKYLFNHDEKIVFLSPKERNNFIQLLQKTLYYIDEKVILDFELAGVWFLYKVLILGFSKKTNNFKQIAYVEKFDAAKNEILISFISYSKPLVSFQRNGLDIIPSGFKFAGLSFVNQQFGGVYKYWVPIDSELEDFGVYIDNNLARLDTKGHRYNRLVTFKEITENIYPISNLEQDIWVLMDRDVQADDNAEHLYRYIQHNYPNQKIYFALSKSSHDWQRLEDDGFNLLDFGSRRHELILGKANRIISSHADKYVMNYLKDQSMLKKSFVFLQHGITQNDLSDWLNSKSNMDLFITATQAEYESIVSNKSKYYFSKKEVKLLGFPRHDKLLAGNLGISKKQLLIMPTWRKDIVGNTVGDGNTRNLNSKFMETVYARHWHSFLNSTELYELCSKYGFSIVFAPHKNIEMYLSEFTLPNYITQWVSSPKETMQKLFQESTLMITDYSSVAFEMGYLNKAVIYYQFDEDTVFNGGHISQKGYFDYSRDGFGPKVVSEKQLFIELGNILQDDGKIPSIYMDRVDSTFITRDGSNCKRVYDAICEIDNPLLDTQADIEFVLSYAQEAFEACDYVNVISRYQSVLAYDIQKYKELAYIRLLKAYYERHQFQDLEGLINAYSNLNLDETNRYLAKLSILKQNYSAAIQLISAIYTKSKKDIFELVKCYCFVGDSKNAKDNIELLYQNYDLNKFELVISEYYVYKIDGNHQLAIEQLKKAISIGLISELKHYKPQLLLSKDYLEIGNLRGSHKLLANYEQHTHDDHDCRVIIAELSFLRKNFPKVISQVSSSFGNNFQYMSLALLDVYGDALFESKMESEYTELKRYFYQNLINDKNALSILLKLFVRDENWTQILFYEKYILNENRLIDYIYYLVLAYKHLGMYSKAYVLIKAIDLPKESILHTDFLKMYGDLSILCNDWEQAEIIFKNLLIHTDADEKKEVWSKILHAQLMRKMLIIEKAAEFAPLLSG